MRNDELEQLGCPKSCLTLAFEYIAKASKDGLLKRYKPKELIQAILDNPQSYFNDTTAGRFAKGIAAAEIMVNKGPVPLKIWGESGIDFNAVEQMRSALTLPVAFQAAMMPDSHFGFSIPVGGVFATVNSVIPIAVGVDIACRMKLTVTDYDIADLAKNENKLIEAIEKETCFGMGKEFSKKRQHAVMDQDWKISPVTKHMKNTAWAQLGTSGSGNHFCEFGIIQFSEQMTGIDVDKQYLALLTHSGSRGTGAKVCNHYNKIAQQSLSKDCKKYRYLPWLSLDTQEGKEYWDAMNLMGNYAAANHDCIHRHVCQNLGAGIILQIENHHNFAWKEIHNGIEVIVHRKGATPAGKGVLGVIPGSMADPAFVVEGLGVPESLMSASHGAGRKYSRSHAKQSFNWEYWNDELKKRGVKLLGAGIDEVPAVYKDILQVMEAQVDLVKPLARFDPKIVKMAGGHEPAED